MMLLELGYYLGGCARRENRFEQAEDPSHDGWNLCDTSKTLQTFQAAELTLMKNFWLKHSG